MGITRKEAYDVLELPNGKCFNKFTCRISRRGTGRFTNSHDTVKADVSATEKAVVISLSTSSCGSLKTFNLVKHIL